MFDINAFKSRLYDTLMHFSFIVILLSILATLVFSSHLEIKTFSESASGRYSRFEFLSSHGINQFQHFTFKFGDTDQETTTPYFPFTTEYLFEFRSIFPEFEPTINPFSPCYCYSTSDTIFRLSPNHCGGLGPILTNSKTLKFQPKMFIPQGWLVSCLVELNILDGRTTNLPIQLIHPPDWFLINPLAIPPYKFDKWNDPLLQIELSLTYTAGDAILGGEQMDYISFSIQNLPPNVLLPFSLGFDTHIEKQKDRIFFLENEQIHYIAQVWNALKPSGAHTPRSADLTPDDPQFFHQTFDMPNPLCGHDVRIIYSDHTGSFKLATGDNPAAEVICTIPIPIFYIHASIAQFSTNQRIETWTGTSILSYLIFNDRLFVQSNSKGNPKWWFHNNPHLLPYSSMLLTTPSLLDIDHEYTILFLGPLPSFNFRQLLSVSSIDTFFSPYNFEADHTDGFLIEFGYFTSSVRSIKFNSIKQLEFRQDDPFGHIYSFELDPDFNGYLLLSLKLKLPPEQFSAFSLQLQTYQTVPDIDKYYIGNLDRDVDNPKNQHNQNNQNNQNSKLLHLGDSGLLNSDTTITTVSDTHISFSFQFTYSRTISKVPLSIELTHVLPAHEFRLADKLMPQICTVQMEDLGTDPPTEYIPVEPATIRIEQNPFLANNFNDDISYYIRVENLHIHDHISTTITCIYAVNPNIIKPNRSILSRFQILSCYALIHNSRYDCPGSYKKKSSPLGEWMEFTSTPAVPGVWTATSTTPISTQVDFDRLLETIFQIIQESTISVGSGEPIESIFAKCLTKDMLRDPAFIPSYFTSPSYHGSSKYPQSLSSQGWTLDNNVPPLSIGSLAIHPNGATLSLIIHDLGRCSIFHYPEYLDLVNFSSKNGVVLTLEIRRSPFYLGEIFHTPQLKYHPSIVGDPEDNYPGRKPGGAYCSSHTECSTYPNVVSFNMGSMISPYQSCFNKKCTTPRPSLTPHEFRLFKQLYFRKFENLKSTKLSDYTLLLRSAITVNTSYDYIPHDNDNFYFFVKLTIFISVCLIIFFSIIVIIRFLLHRRKRHAANSATAILVEDEKSVSLLSD